MIVCLIGLSACATAQDESTADAVDDEQWSDVIEDTSVTTGIYISSFEASILYPCEEPGERWWMSTNAEFSERYRALTKEDEEPVCRGTHVLVRVEGDKTEFGQYGHLGAYSREFTVTSLIDMRRIDSEPEGDEAEWIHAVCEVGF